MKKKAFDFFIEGYLDVGQKLPKQIKWLPISMWIVFYMSVVVVMFYLAKISGEGLLYGAAIGFLVVLLGMVGVIIEYILRHKNINKREENDNEV